MHVTLVVTGFGAGLGLGLVLFGAAYVLYKSQQNKVKVWNSKFLYFMNKNLKFLGKRG